MTPQHISVLRCHSCLHHPYYGPIPTYPLYTRSYGRCNEADNACSRANCVTYLTGANEARVSVFSARLKYNRSMR